MILPTKGIEPNKALISIGGVILGMLNESKTVSRLWGEVRKSNAESHQVSFDWFVLALTFLYTLGAIERIGGRLVRATGAKEATS